MIQVILSLLFALLFAAPADAQFRNLPELVVVDARNVVIGQVVGFGGANPDDPWQGTSHGWLIYPIDMPIVVFRSGQNTIKVALDSGTIYGDTGVMFRSQDCTGAPYLLPEAAAGAVIRPSAVFMGIVYQWVPTSVGRAVTVGSYGEGTFCTRIEPLSGDTPVQAWGYPATRIVNLNGRWTPPFRLR